MKLSSYAKHDKAEIKQLFIQVFSESEGILIGNLVSDLINNTNPQDIFGYVATDNEQIIGCIFFTRLVFDKPIEAFILSPVAVQTKYQGKGVGKKLINFGISTLKEAEVKILITYGDPNFYSKTGFQSISEKIIQAPQKLSQPEGWLCQTLDGSKIQHIPGKPRCVEALNKAVYW